MILLTVVGLLGWALACFYLVLLQKERQENESLHKTCDMWLESSDRRWKETLELKKKLEESYGGRGDL